MPEQVSSDHRSTRQPLTMSSLSCVPKESLSMRRNLRIAGILFGFTVAVNILLYQRESTWAPKNTLNVTIHHHDNNHHDNNHHDNHPAATEPPTSPGPIGDGSLHQQISTAARPFTPDLPKQLVILGYQRVGSSFFGQIFDQNSDFFYIYEPLDAVYAEMYGTAGGVNVPSDITYWANGTQRTVPEAEKSAVSKLLADILGCHVADLPQGFLLHKYWYFLVDSYMPSWRGYRACFKRHKILTAREDCAVQHLRKTCPNRFNFNVHGQELCKKNLASAVEGDGSVFGQYKSCLSAAFKSAAQCIPMYERKCKNAKLWATKTVRGTMDEMDVLLESNPNMRVIHLIRDPRPVVVSRKSEPSYRGLYTGNITNKRAGDLVKEAHMYCGTVLKDLKHRKLLEERYPGRVVQVIYEDFVQNPQEYVKAIYKFLDETIPHSILTWIRRNTEGGKHKTNSIMKMKAWTKKITVDEGERIGMECKEVYDLLNYKWPYRV